MSIKHLNTVMLILSLVLIVCFGGFSFQSSTSNDVYFYFVKMSPWLFIPFVLLLMNQMSLFWAKSPDIKNKQLPAGALIRAFAFLIDCFSILPLLMIPFGYVLVFLEFHATGQLHWTIQRDHKMPYDSIGAYGVFICLLMFIILLSLPLTLNKQTLGQFITGVYLKSKKRISFSSSVARLILGYFGMCILLLGVLSSVKDKKKRMWQDKAFGTEPIDVNPEHIDGE